jgi:molybdopterin-guanine dinucleotide biosynthesis protein A
MKEFVILKRKLSFSAVLLAGGESKRMGMKKAFLKIGEETFIEIIHRRLEKLFSETIVVTDLPQEFTHLSARLTTDIIQDGAKNSLRGIHAGLSVASYPACFVIGCDMPFFSLALVEYMSQFALDYEVVVPSLEGYYQPLFAFYHKKSLGLIEQRLIEKRYKIHDLLAHFHLKAIEEEAIREYDPSLLSFNNINSPEDYRKILDFWDKQKDNLSLL